MVAKSGALDSLLEFPDSLKLKYKEQADRCSLQFIYDALAVTSQCEAGYKESINPRLHIEFALMKLCFLTGGPVSLKQPAPQPVQVVQPAKATSAATASQPVQAPVSVNAEAQSQPSAQTVQTVQTPQVAQDEALRLRHLSSRNLRLLKVRLPSLLREENVLPRRLHCRWMR